jgi:acyl-CoA synthetase (AMP-forming)/AMP-acid ligase II
VAAGPAAAGPAAAVGSVPELFGAILRESPQAEAIVDGDCRLTFAGWWHRAAVAASGLAAAGAGPGGIVCLMMPSSADFAICYLAAMRLGAVVTAINPRLGATEIRSILDQAGPALVVTDEPDRIAPDQALAVRTAADLYGHPATGEVTSAAAAGDFAAEAPAGEPAVIVWTTGTTGTPKGAWFDHESLRVIARGIGPLSAAGDRKLMPVPFAHTAYMTRIYDQLIHRYALILTPRAWTARSMLDLIVSERVTVGQGVPAQWEKLLMLDELAAADLSCLRLVSTGASRVPPSLVRAMRERLGCPVVVRYASTEVPLCSGTALDDPAEIVAATVGRPLGDVEAEVRDEDGRTMLPSAIGRVFLRSRGSMRGYWRAPDLTAETMAPDGWIATSDLGSLDAAGYLTVIGRTDDAYIRGGYNVHPAEVEQVLLAHPGIARAAVVGAPAPVIGEAGVAFVVASPGAAAPAAEEVRAWCRDRIAGYKVPDVVLGVADLPVNATYKVDRTELRRLAARAVASQAEAGRRR